MNQKITPDHLGRGAVVYVRQSTMGQVVENTESGRRQYALAKSARTMGFASVAIIDDDLGRSGSGTIERLGFQKLVASVCAGSIGAIFCIEASRLARNGRDWRLIDLCALVGALVIDPDGTYDPRLVNDRLLLGLKGRMSEYELAAHVPHAQTFCRYASACGYSPISTAARCGRVMRVFYGTSVARPHRYHCRGDDNHVGSWLCIGIGGLQIDKAVAAQIVEAVSGHAVEAAIKSGRADCKSR